MQWMKSLCLFGVSFGVVFCAACFASAQEVSFVSNPLWLSTAGTTEGETVLASTVITKSGTEHIDGEVTFYSNGESIGAKAFSLPPNVGGVVVTVSFTPKKGTHLISAKVTRANVTKDGATKSISVSGEAKAGETLAIEPDADKDKIADDADTDDDNDGVSDADEANTAASSASGSAEVAGASTSAAISGAADTAKNVGAKIFAQTESLRGSAANYFDMKLKDAAEVRAEKQAAAAEIEDGADLDQLLVSGPKPLAGQLEDTSGILEGLKIQVYKIFSFIFNNVYAFYTISILFVLWIVRKIWRRYSLD